MSLTSKHLEQDFILGLATCKLKGNINSVKNYFHSNFTEIMPLQLVSPLIDITTRLKCYIHGIHVHPTSISFNYEPSYTATYGHGT